MEATDGQKIHEVVGTRDCALDSVCSQLLWPCEVSSTHAKYRDKMFICPAYSLACVCENCAAARCVNSCFKMSFNTPWVRIPFSLYLICCWLPALSYGEEFLPRSHSKQSGSKLPLLHTWRVSPTATSRLPLLFSRAFPWMNKSFMQILFAIKYQADTSNLTMDAQPN